MASSPLQPMTAMAPRFACHCGKSFIRKEHMVRHQATHEQMAYACDVCQRRFSRKELLRRHVVLHDPDRTRTVVSCDACRVNKTKCSGGTQCSLCERRGVDCAFNMVHRRRKKQATVDGPTPGNDSARDDGNVGKDAGTAMSICSTPQSARTKEQSLTKRQARSHEWLDDVIIVRSKPVPPGEVQPRGRGMEAIHEMLTTQTSCLDGATRRSNDLQQWLDECSETYINSFHHRWPIVNAPSFDVTNAFFPLAASVCVIGTWLQRRSDLESGRPWALRVHEILLQRLIQNLTDPEALSPGRAWPLELFQATLLTLIFTLYRTDKSALSRAALLRGTYITFLRGIGMLNTDVFYAHLDEHFNGTFAPYVLSMRESFKRLLALTYQFDVYFALAHGTPPMLHRQELCADLTVTYALWNAHGLDVFGTRLYEEPLGRRGFQISSMTSSPKSFTASPLLIEDIMLGLCGVLQAIWVCTQTLPSKTKSFRSNPFQETSLIEALDAWKTELDKISTLGSPRTIMGDAARYLFLAYRARDDSVTAILERIETLTCDCMVLFYFLKVYHYTGLSSSEFVGLVKRSEDASEESWRTTKCGREALVCALQMLKLVESIGFLDKVTNPLSVYALALGGNLVRRVLVSCEKCECLVDQRATCTDLQRWIQASGQLSIDDKPICVCQLKFWTDRFENAIIKARASVMETI